jgi:hypothetical protein
MTAMKQRMTASLNYYTPAPDELAELELKSETDGSLKCSDHSRLLEAVAYGFV